MKFREKNKKLNLFYLYIKKLQVKKILTLY